MSRTREHRRFPQLEALESRLQLSASIPANSIGTSAGTVQQPGNVSAASVTVTAKNLTVGKTSTLFGIFVGPGSGSTLAPRILGVKASDGHVLPMKQGRPFVAGRADGQAAEFVRISQPGDLTVLVTGGHRSTGAYSLVVTLPGDVNGDRTANQADVAPFAPSYLTSPGDQKYNVAADFNQNGIVNLFDAKALEENMPAAKTGPLTLVTNLIAADQAHYRTPSNSGGTTFKRNVVVIGRTLPGSIVIQDGTSGFYKWVGPAYATDSRGFFMAPETLTQGVNTFDFLVIDPFGRQLIRSFPIFWLPFAAAGSRLK